MAAGMAARPSSRSVRPRSFEVASRRAPRGTARAAPSLRISGIIARSSAQGPARAVARAQALAVTAATSPGVSSPEYAQCTVFVSTASAAPTAATQASRKPYARSNPWSAHIVRATEVHPMASGKSGASASEGPSACTIAISAVQSGPVYPSTRSPAL